MGSDGAISIAALFDGLSCQVPAGQESFVPRRESMSIEYDDPDIGEFISSCAKQFCPWCGAPVMRNKNGRPKKFCSDKCRWSFWKFEMRHKAEKTEMEARLNEKR